MLLEMSLNEGEKKFFLISWLTNPAQIKKVEKDHSSSKRFSMSPLPGFPVAILASLRWSADSAQNISPGGNLIGADVWGVVVQGGLFRGNCSGKHKLGGNCPGGEFIWGNYLGSECPGRGLFGDNCPGRQSLEVTVLGGFQRGIFLGQLNFFEAFTFRISWFIWESIFDHFLLTWFFKNSLIKFVSKQRDYNGYNDYTLQA